MSSKYDVAFIIFTIDQFPRYFIFRLLLLYHLPTSLPINNSICCFNFGCIPKLSERWVRWNTFLIPRNTTEYITVSETLENVTGTNLNINDDVYRQQHLLPRQKLRRSFDYLGQDVWNVRRGTRRRGNCVRISI